MEVYNMPITALEILNGLGKYTGSSPARVQRESATWFENFSGSVRNRWDVGGSARLYKADTLLIPLIIPYDLVCYTIAVMAAQDYPLPWNMSILDNVLYQYMISNEGRQNLARVQDMDTKEARVRLLSYNLFYQDLAKFLNKNNLYNWPRLSETAFGELIPGSETRNRAAIEDDTRRALAGLAISADNMSGAALKVEDSLRRASDDMERLRNILDQATPAREFPGLDELIRTGLQSVSGAYVEIGESFSEGLAAGLQRPSDEEVLEAREREDFAAFVATALGVPSETLTGKPVEETDLSKIKVSFIDISNKRTIETTLEDAIIDPINKTVTFPVWDESLSFEFLIDAGLERATLEMLYLKALADLAGEPDPPSPYAAPIQEDGNKRTKKNPAGIMPVDSKPEYRKRKKL